ncbi:hypothetical protein ASZ78_016167 [Callipepla squamata]|uniref:Uncharacterized protein n=1 Tax=Callipepla squamata TaxID=9009 RepID=A0A226MA10_CALSU|nr:hypothetical protein ASZ78_016167 [Callipepla squamata]
MGRPQRCAFPPGSDSDAEGDAEERCGRAPGNVGNMISSISETELDLSSASSSGRSSHLTNSIEEASSPGSDAELEPDAPALPGIKGALLRCHDDAVTELRPRADTEHGGDPHSPDPADPDPAAGVGRRRLFLPVGPPLPAADGDDSEEYDSESESEPDLSEDSDSPWLLSNLVNKMISEGSYPIKCPDECFPQPHSLCDTISPASDLELSEVLDADPPGPRGPPHGARPIELVDMETLRSSLQRDDEPRALGDTAEPSGDDAGPFLFLSNPTHDTIAPVFPGQRVSITRLGGHGEISTAGRACGTMGTELSTTGSDPSTTGMELSTTGTALSSVDGGLSASAKVYSDADRALSSTDRALSTTGSAHIVSDRALSTTGSALNAVNGTFSTMDSSINAVNGTFSTMDSDTNRADMDFNTADSALSAVNGTFNTTGSALIDVNMDSSTTDSALNDVNGTFSITDSGPNRADRDFSTTDSARNALNGTFSTMDSAPIALNGTFSTMDSAPIAVNGTFSTMDSAPIAVNGTFSTMDSAPIAVNGTLSSAGSAVPEPGDLTDAVRLEPGDGDPSVPDVPTARSSRRSVGMDEDPEVRDESLAYDAVKYTLVVDEHTQLELVSLRRCTSVLSDDSELLRACQHCDVDDEEEEEEEEEEEDEATFGLGPAAADGHSSSEDSSPEADVHFSKKFLNVFVNSTSRSSSTESFGLFSCTVNGEEREQTHRAVFR